MQLSQLPSIVGSVILLGVGCASSEPVPTPVTPGNNVVRPTETPPPVEAAGEEDLGFDSRALQALDQIESFQPWTVVPVRQYTRENTVVLVVWPMLNPDGEVVDDDTLAVVLRGTPEGGYVVEGEPRDVNFIAPYEFSELLGGDDFDVFPPAGLELEQIGPGLVSSPTLFCEAIQSGAPADALPEVIQLARMYPADAITQLENVAEVLIGVCEGRMALSFNENRRISSSEAEVHMTIMSAGASTGGPLILETTTNESGLWVFTGERSH